MPWLLFQLLCKTFPRRLASTQAPMVFRQALRGLKTSLRLQALLQPVLFRLLVLLPVLSLELVPTVLLLLLTTSIVFNLTLSLLCKMNLVSMQVS
jgi:diacylglycerol kinase